MAAAVTAAMAASVTTTVTASVTASVTLAAALALAITMTLAAALALTITMTLTAALALAIATATAQADAITIALTASLATAMGNAVSYGQACFSITGSGFCHFTFGCHPLVVTKCQSLWLPLSVTKSKNRRMESQFMADFSQAQTVCSHGRDSFDSNTRYFGCQIISFVLSCFGCILCFFGCYSSSLNGSLIIAIFLGSFICCL
jgi:hypothetical protein